MFSWIRTAFRKHFGFSRAEASGAFVLLCLTSLCLLVSQSLKWYYSMHSKVVHDQDIALLEHTLAMLDARKQNHPSTPVPIPDRRPQPVPRFDINTADTTQLSAIRGIGSILSSRIVKFRNKLGGFVSQEQYQEVYGLPPEVVVELRKSTYISTGFQPTKIDINIADVATLSAHPYLTYRQSRSIVHYRSQHGPFLKLGVLGDLVLIDSATLGKITPYLTVSP